jgi:Tol biopolymer transport system component
VPGAPGTNVTSAVSLASDGTFHGPVLSSAPTATSADGRYVAFSASSALVGNDANGFNDVFLRDRVAGTTIRLSSDSVSHAAPTGGVSTDVSMTPDGLFVAFDSTADLIPTDTNGKEDVYVYDVTAATLSLVSVSDTGTQGNKDSLKPAISADGQTIAFLSFATNLVGAEALTASGHNIYVRTRSGVPTTKRVSLAVGGGFPAEGVQMTGGPSISADGRFIGYASDAANIVVGDTNAVQDGFVYDVTGGTTTRVSLGQGGVQANAASQVPVFSADGHYAAFQSDASNLVSGDTNARTDIFVRDLVGGTTTRVSVTDSGSQANDSSTGPFISADGTRVLFTSTATNLVVGDTNAAPDAFVRRLSSGETLRVSLGAGQLAAGGNARGLSSNGLVALFASADASIGGAADTNAADDLFARTLG